MFITIFPLEVYVVNMPKFCCLEAHVISEEVKLTVSENATKPFYSRYQFMCSVFSDKTHEVYIIRLGKWFSSVISIISVTTGEKIKIIQEFSSNFLFIAEDNYLLAKLKFNFIQKTQSYNVVLHDKHEVSFTKNNNSLLTPFHGHEYGDVHIQANSSPGAKMDVRIIIGIIILDVFLKNIGIFDTMT